MSLQCGGVIELVPAYQCIHFSILIDESFSVTHIYFIFVRAFYYLHCFRYEFVNLISNL